MENQSENSKEETLETEEVEVIVDDNEEIAEEGSEDEKKAVDDTKDLLMRTMAEFDNYRKRTEKEKVQRYEVGVKDVLEKILPVIDNFERALSGLSEEDKKSNLGQGIEMIYKQFLTILKDMNVVAIEAVGKPFDPNFHNAVMHTEEEGEEENKVVEEFQKGYMYKETVLRHSMVKVVN